MEVSSDRVPGGRVLPPEETPPKPCSSGDPDEVDPDEVSDLDQVSLTAENCYELLTAAKSRGLAELTERCYAFMSDHFLTVLRSPAVYGRLTAAERERVLARRLEGSSVLSVAEVDEEEAQDRVVVGGGSRPPSRPQSPLSPGPAASPVPEDRDPRRRRIFCYDAQTKEWRVLCALPEEVCTRGAGMCTFYNYLFVAGGLVGGRASARVFCYNPRTDAWSETRPLTQARSQLRLVAVDAHLFAVGGELLLTVERYDPRADRWSAAAPLPRGAFAVAHEAAACDGALFVSGGSLSYRLLRLDARRGEWDECPFNDSRGRSTDMVAHRRFVYRFDVYRERGGGVTVSRYDTVVKVWRGGASFALGDAARPFRCAVLGDRVYCVNGTRALQFVVDGDREGFLPEVLDTPAEARGNLVPFVLTLTKSD